MTDRPKAQDARTSHTADRSEIAELLSRHQMYIDLAEAEDYAGLYTPDGTYESPFASASGRTEIAEMFRGLRASGFTTNKRHFNGQSMVDLEGSRATAVSYWSVADYAGEQPAVFATGTYRDQLQKLEGVWKIARRVRTMDTSTADRAG